MSRATAPGPSRLEKQSPRTLSWPSPCATGGWGEGLPDLSRAHPHASTMLLSLSEMSNQRQELLIQ